VNLGVLVLAIGLGVALVLHPDAAWAARRSSGSARSRSSSGFC